ncbi:di-trans,poly-cis-decaprenylcistransferase [Sedimentibacter sp. zth1]|uniref:polyprenyl diphosphate synthase n=1 Tax=Sedimentibacter sp. zth1 TaxID=2816908 RepID=UPI001A9295D0|nr:polyprenyl diphosphate synthase [Sedimentibacter sp. zth1]QSX05739.1 di-trans,poly-cis-decaprenylcistransferase [Sedimentibacter sp. zth1]
MRIPKHIAIIPDGNRRWANRLGLDKYMGYDHGLNPGVDVLRLAKEYGVKELTYYGFTTDNCKRPTIEVKAFTTACIDAVRMIQKENVNLLVVGNTESNMFPKELLPYTKSRVSIGKDEIKVNFLVNYGWEWDLSNMNIHSTNRNTIMSLLNSKDISRIDLIIRWGGRKRLSGLLPVQAVYADIYTIDKMWPEFTKQQFIEALKWYDTQDVTLGG